MHDLSTHDVVTCLHVAGIPS